MKVGIYGGSFDPVHEGHVRLAQYVLEHTDVDEVWLMVSPLNPLKPQGYVASDTERLEMARIALKDVEGVKASDFEFSLPRPSYTYNTLCRLKERYPEHEFRLIIGGDNWASFDRWRNPKEILSEFGVIVYPRPGEKTSDAPRGVTVLEGAPLMDVSSTMVREMLGVGPCPPTKPIVKAGQRPDGSEEELRREMNPDVLEYIRKHNIYGKCPPKDGMHSTENTYS